jgi:hypothetical protein
MANYPIPNRVPLPTMNPGQGGIMGAFPPAPAAPAPAIMQAGSNPNGILDLGAGAPGEIRRGPGGQNYQRVETTGMDGNGGRSQGWIPVNGSASRGGQGGGIRQWLGNNSEALAAMSKGLLTGRTGSEQFAQGFGGFVDARAAGKKKTRTMEFLQQQDPLTAQAVELGLLTGPEAFKAIYDAKNKPTEYQKRAQAYRDAGGDPNSPEGRAYTLTGQLGGPDLPNSYQEWQLAAQGGYEGSFADWKKSNSGGTTVNVGDGAPGLGKLSTDYGYKLGPDGKPVIGPDGLPMAAPIPGSPAARDIESGQRQRGVQQSARDVSTRTITTAAQRAREAANNRALGPVGQGIVGAINPYSDSAEVQRQVEVLKSNAKIENLTAMRAASPTGGALGAVSDKESEMLAAKSGALDPSSPAFERDLNDYELTLLQIVHGFEAGTQIYNATRSGSIPLGQEADSGIGQLLDKYDPQR